MSATLEDVLADHRMGKVGELDADCTCGLWRTFFEESEETAVNMHRTHVAWSVRAWIMEQRDLIARTMAQMEPGEDWPTNVALGGHAMLGTRDDEFKSAMEDQADEVVAALTNASAP